MHIEGVVIAGHVEGPLRADFGWTQVQVARVRTKHALGRQHFTAKGGE